MQLTHLGLPVRDPQRSIDFYHRYFGFDPATAQEFPDGTVIVRNEDGFDLALHPSEPPAEFPDFLHFGFALPDGAQVRELLTTIDAAGVPVVERHDGPGHVSFKCLDPDGWRVEAYWDA